MRLKLVNLNEALRPDENNELSPQAELIACGFFFAKSHGVRQKSCTDPLRNIAETRRAVWRDFFRDPAS